MRNHRTPQRPIFDVKRPLGANWTWYVSYRVASSGYPTECQVTAERIEASDHMGGSATCDVSMYDDLREVIECLAVEAMLAACEPNLFDVPTARRIVFTSGYND